MQLTAESEQVSGGAVQIGNAIAEKKLLDVLLQARDAGLYHAVTDCGAGGFSSAVGEMAEGLGASVQLDQAPLKYAGLSYTEIWISEAQERMVLAVAPEQVAEAAKAVRRRGRGGDGARPFRGDGPIAAYLSGEQQVADLDHALSPQRPADGGAAGDVATRSAQRSQERSDGADRRSRPENFNDTLLKILALAERVQQGMDHPPVRSRSAGRQRHQAAGRRARRRARRCGGGDAGAGRVDAAWRSAAASIRVTATSIPTRWPPPPSMRRCATSSRSGPILRGSLYSTISAGATRIAPKCSARWCCAAEACRDVALAYSMPFISGKDSLNNEYHSGGTQHRHSADAAHQRPRPRSGRAPLRDDGPEGAGQSAFPRRRDEGRDGRLALPSRARSRGRRRAAAGPGAGAAHCSANCIEAIQHGLVRSCHDLSEGGLAVAVAEMAFAGGIGADLTGLARATRCRMR